MGLFDERVAYKPFEYPEYYNEGWLKQAQAFWLHTEIPMSGDLKDWNEKLTDKSKYEGETFVLLNGFHFDNECYERQANGKGDYTNRGSKRILPIKYTPDFIGQDFIIETKGRANESFPMRWKLFKQLVTNQFPSYTLYKPQNQKECDRTVELILEKQRN